MKINWFWKVESRIQASLAEMEKRIVSQITDFAAAVEADYAKVATDLNTLKTGIANQATQITNLQAQLAASGTLSAADLAVLNQARTDADALAATADSIANPAPPAPPTSGTGSSGS